MKRLFTLFVISSLLLSALTFSSIATDSYVDLFTTPQNNTASKYKQKFWDVGKEHWAFEYIAELSLRGVINGYADGSFKPENTVTRAEWAKIMILVAGITPNDNSVIFSDMKGHWANTYVNAASKYLTAFNDNSYRPDQAVTREDVTMALVKLKGYTLSEVDYSVLARFKDVASISNSMKVYVAIAVEKGLINGFEDSTFRGQATLTRAEASTLLWRAFQFGNDNKTEASAGVVTPPAETPSTSENNYNTPDDTTDDSEIQPTPSPEAEENKPSLNINKLDGTYIDILDMGARMDIKKDNNTYRINIEWNKNATQSVQYFFFAKKSGSKLTYENGYQFKVVINEDETVDWNLISEECEGDFSISGSHIIWNDYSEDISERCKFEIGKGLSQRNYKSIYETATIAIKNYTAVCMTSDILENGIEKKERISKQYDSARGLLLSCMGYKDSDKLFEKIHSVQEISLKIADSIYNKWSEKLFYRCSGSMRDSMMYIQNEAYDESSYDGLLLKFKYDKTSFDAKITNMYYLDSGEKILLIVSLFAEDYKEAVFDRLLNEKLTREDNQSFSLYYGGYNIDIVIEPSGYGYNYVNISIKGEKGEKRENNTQNNPSSSPSTDYEYDEEEEEYEESTPDTPETEEYHYISYYAEYVIDENTSGSINTWSEEDVMNHIEEKNATLVGEIKVFKKVLPKNMGNYFKDSETGLYFYLEY